MYQCGIVYKPHRWNTKTEGSTGKSNPECLRGVHPILSANKLFFLVEQLGTGS